MIEIRYINSASDFGILCVTQLHYASSSVLKTDGNCNSKCLLLNDTWGYYILRDYIYKSKYVILRSMALPRKGGCGGSDVLDLYVARFVLRI